MVYFWYGSHFYEAEAYRKDPSVTIDRNTIKAVSCYKSTDLIHWKDMGHVLTEDSIKAGRRWAGWFARMGVAYIEETKQYALLSQHNNSVMVSLDNPHTPHINYMNTREDRQVVIGEKSLCISDSIAFERKVSQDIISTPFVALPDGEYELILMFRDNGLFNKLTATVESNGKRQFLDLKKLKTMDKWTKATLNVTISGGKAKLTFYAVGKPMAQCLIDDVELKLKK